MSSLKRSVVSLNKNGEMRLKNKVGLAITRDNCYEERALNTRLQEIDKHKDKTGKYLDGRKVDFARKNVKNGDKERPNTIDTSSTLPPIHQRNSKRRSQSVPVESLESIQEKRHELPKIENMQLCEQSEEISPPKGKRRRKNQKVNSSKKHEHSEDKRKAFVTENEMTSAGNSRENTMLPQIGVQTGEDLINDQGILKRKEKKGTVNLPKLLEVSRQKSLLDSTDPRFQRLETCLVQCPPDCEHIQNMRI